MQRARRTFPQRVRRAAAKRVIFLDEFGMNLGMTRRDARAPRGARACGHAPINADPNLTLTLGLSRNGLLAPFVFQGAMDGSAFEADVRTQLTPCLRRGDLVIADGLSAHRVVGARHAIEARGARYEILPPYSPDLNPVEEAGSKVKQRVRAEAPRTVPAAYAAMGRAIGRVSRRDARGWFRLRAGYLLFRTKRGREPL